MVRRTSLFTPEFLHKLEALGLATRQSLAGPGIGPRRSPRLGMSVEFSDFRNYAPGDDYRRIDWNAYARLERLFLRLYRAEENLTVSLLLDTSRSMAWGEPSKFDLACRVAGALALPGPAEVRPGRSICSRRRPQGPSTGRRGQGPCLEGMGFPGTTSATGHNRPWGVPFFLCFALLPAPWSLRPCNRPVDRQRLASRSADITGCTSGGNRTPNLGA